MHKQIFGALVVGLAAACWMVAQYAVGQPAVAPLSGNSIPPLLDPGERRLPPLSGAPPESNPPMVPPPPAIAPTTGPGPLPLLDGSASGLDMPMPAIPPPPALQELPKPQLLTTPAINGFPSLPQVPGTPPTPPLYLVNSANADQSTGTEANGQSAESQLIGNRQAGGSVAVNPAPGQMGPMIWGGADYLLWFPRTAQTPTLLQSSGGSSIPTALYPSSGGINYNPMSGIKGTFGFWLNDVQTLGVETTYFWFSDNTRLNTYQGNSNFAIGHPYIDANSGNSAVDPVSSLNGPSGTSAIRTGLQINGGDSSLLLSPGVQMGNFSMLLGFRYLDMEEYLNINDVSVSSKSTLSAADSFTTRNQFFGGQTGLRYSWTCDNLSFTMSGKIAYGALNETVGIEGSSTMTTSAGSSTRSGGIYALNSNIGNYSQTAMAFIPEFNAKLGWRITPWATAMLGYNFLYVSQVVRPGGQIDPTINPANLPFGSSSTNSTAARPAFAFHNESFWMQGVNIGMTFQY